MNLLANRWTLVGFIGDYFIAKPRSVRAGGISLNCSSLLIGYPWVSRAFFRPSEFLQVSQNELKNFYLKAYPARRLSVSDKSINSGRSEYPKLK
jgi:hypothetical protein